MRANKYAVVRERSIPGLHQVRPLCHGAVQTSERQGQETRLNHPEGERVQDQQNHSFCGRIGEDEEQAEYEVAAG